MSLDIRYRGRRNEDGSYARDPIGNCVWCGKPTPIVADTPFRPDLGALPLHLLCGVWMRDAYKKWQSGQVLDADDIDGMKRLTALPKLGDGSAG